MKQELESSVIAKNFIPFGGGIRQCAGADFTRLSLATFLHVLVTKYRSMTPTIYCSFSLMFFVRHIMVKLIMFEFFWFRWTNIKVGKLSRNPMLGFGDDIHINLSINHS